MSDFKMDAFSDGGLGDDFLSDVDDTEEIKEEVNLTDDDELNSIPDDEETEEVEEEVDDNTEDEEEETDGKDSQKNNNSNSRYSTFYNYLSESLPFLSTEEEIKVTSADELRDLIIQKIENEVKSREFSDLTDTQKEYMEALRAGVPEEAVKQNLQATNSLNSVTDDDIETNDDLREQLILQAFLSEGLSEARAKKLTKMSIDAGTDIDDAKESLNQLKETVVARAKSEKEAALQARKDQEKSYQDSLKSLKETLASPEKIFGEKAFTPKYQKELYDLITTPQESNGQQMDFLSKYVTENPVASRAVLAHLYKVTNGFDPKSIKGLNPKTIKSKVTREIEDVIAKGSNSWFGGNDDEENLFEKGDSDNISNQLRFF